MKQLLRIKFSDFWKGFDVFDNFILQTLQKHYRVEFSENPDVLIYSSFGINFLKYDCHRIYYTCENYRPDFNECDLALSFDYPDYGGKNIRLPFYVGFWEGNIRELLKPKDPELILRNKNKFCGMVVSNHRGNERNTFFQKLHRRKPVESGGMLYNNVGGIIKDKIGFLSGCKFSLTFENSSYPGYTTEKIYDAMRADSVPVYWGNPDVGTDFNPQSFINVHDYQCFDDAIDHLLEIDRDDSLYLSMLSQPFLPNNTLQEHQDQEEILKKMVTAIDLFNGSIPVAQDLEKAKIIKRKYSVKVFRYAIKDYWKYNIRQIKKAVMG